MVKIKTTDEEVRKVLREFVAERPDYIYAAPPNIATLAPRFMCYYVHKDEPGCLIGHVLHKLGIPLEQLKALEHQGAGKVADQCLEGISYETRRFLTNAQGAQDEGMTWGAALNQEEEREPYGQR